MGTKQNVLILGLTLATALPMVLTACSDRQDDASRTGTKATVGNKIDDTVITAKVKSALLADSEIKSFDLKVETRKGAVQLSGFVDNQLQIDRAISVARSIEGVSGVDNSVTMKEGKTSVGNIVDDGIITTQIKSALLAEPSISSADIAVVTRKGLVQLSGYVNSPSQISQATGIARKVNGVVGVVNEMSVKK